jgi:xylan 1,4-beta-xylosidase
MEARTLSPSLNPILPGFYPDPSVCRHGDTFFMVHSTFGFFPGLPLFTSKDLMTWTQAGHVLDRGSQLPLAGAAASNGGLYAPTIRCHEGRFYVIVTNISHGGNFLVWTDDPFGDWSDPVWLKDGAETGIDPSLFFEGGDVWLCGTGTFHRQGIQAAKIDLATGRVLGEPIELWQGTGGRYPEGPHIFRRGDWLYLTMAEGGTELGHMQTIARSRQVEGPWEPCPHNPILTHRSMPSVLQAVGHSDLIEDPQGQWWIVFHGIRVQGYPEVHLLGRETCIAPVEWSQEGLPVVNQGALIPVRKLEEGEPGWRIEGFQGLDWITLRGPLGSRGEVKAGGEALALAPQPEGLESRGFPSFYGVRQRASVFEMSVEAEFSSAKDGDAAGVAVFMNEDFWASFGLTGEEGDLVLTRRVGDMEVRDVVGRPAAGPVTLRLRGEPERYEVSARDSQGQEFGPKAFLSRCFSTEVAGGFTGVVLGMWAQGRAGSKEAVFSRFLLTSSSLATERGQGQ